MSFVVFIHDVCVCVCRSLLFLVYIVVFPLGELNPLPPTNEHARALLISSRRNTAHMRFTECCGAPTTVRGEMVDRPGGGSNEETVHCGWLCLVETPFNAQLTDSPFGMRFRWQSPKPFVGGEGGRWIYSLKIPLSSDDYRISGGAVHLGLVYIYFYIFQCVNAVGLWITNFGDLGILGEDVNYAAAHFCVVDLDKF